MSPQVSIVSGAHLHSDTVIATPPEAPAGMVAIAGVALTASAHLGAATVSPCTSHDLLTDLRGNQ
jgi:hypothetical protein